MPIPRVLTIAGSDSGGGAGIQADLKTFTVLETYGMSVLTALTAQNTLGVHAIQSIPPSFVTAQIEAVLSDIGADAVKTGMLDNREVVLAVAEALERFPVPHLVVDPVMVSKSGHFLLKPEAVEALVRHLLPLATLVTPNTEEAAVLAETGPIDSMETMREAGNAILRLGCRAVLLKGGHLEGEDCTDLYMDGSTEIPLSAPRYSSLHTHGTGCTLSAALAAYLARGLAPIEAVRQAKEFVSEAIRTARPLGGGIGPVNHLWRKNRDQA